MRIGGVNDYESLRVYRGDNNLKTSFQYNIIGQAQRHVMTVKFYDKVLDLIGREGCKCVSSRCSHILCSRRVANSVEQSMRLAQYTGLTRVEVSIFLSDEDDTRVKALAVR